MNKHLVGVAAAVVAFFGAAVFAGSASASRVEPGLIVGATLTPGVYDTATGTVTQPFACHAFSALNGELSPVTALVFSPVDGCVLQRRSAPSAPWTTVAVAP